jgi:hypothetical protein
MLDWLKEEEPVEEAAIVQVVDRFPASLPAQEGLKLIRDRMLHSALEGMEAATAFADIDPEQTEPPPEWVAKYGLESAVRRLKIAKMAWLPAKVAPLGLTMMPKVALGIMNIDAKLKSPPRTMNLTIQMPAPVLRDE